MKLEAKSAMCYMYINLLIIYIFFPHVYCLINSFYLIQPSFIKREIYAVCPQGQGNPDLIKKAIEFLAP